MSAQESTPGNRFPSSISAALELARKHDYEVFVRSTAGPFGPARVVETHDKVCTLVVDSHTDTQMSVVRYAEIVGVSWRVSPSARRPKAVAP